MATEVINGLAVEIYGDGQPLLCIHGLGGSSNTWTPVLPAMEGFKVIRIDLPGSARSALPVESLSIAGYVAAIATTLDALAAQQVHVAAHSLGTIIAQHFAVTFPERVRSLALFGPLLAPPEQGRPAIHARAQLAREGISGMQQIADAIVNGATSRETKEQQPAVLALVRESVMRQPPEGYAQSCEALAAAQPARVEQISVPTLLVTGDQDGVAPPAAVQSMGERIAGANVFVLTGCGHWTTFEKPMECSNLLREFYRDLS
ncbi:alpha/beta fold hydrolase [Cupriavidus metallidurans]|uniref:Hydrolase or acyltransferase (Alpha/beta hydrolase superfamily) n=2 Tax=Cupriavidus metallidurans (strain ATCC 43123 / DSM 2839 / NBRC 102507 / CH34) TaxID=266264 RepID=Q1LAH1_CUPMC|nr:alpha/beta fold hydrolase [Cupriavidus metallidurans]ABF12855.1 hydrolase or acyltransferase (alpha/beta hydrolase superfamily) [Cupriavidus metallidurans CH34]QGS31157.1 alpha/beta fold hydrolase [Cupriavidus metallidurans]